MKVQIQQWQARGEYASASGHEFFYIDEGDHAKPTLLLIHGFPTSSWDWAPVWDDLLRQYRLVAMDMLGFGFSDKPNRRDYTIHGQADLVEALIDHLSLKQFHVLAHDYGDTVAQELLARRQEGGARGEMLSCCFLNGGLFPETHEALLTQRLLLSPIGPLINRLSGKKQFGSAFSKVFGADTQPHEEMIDAFWSLINLNGGKHIFHNLITYMRDRIEHLERWVTALQKSEIPLALINGSVDPVSGAHMVARYQQLQCRLDYLKELPAIGHYPQVEAPMDVTASYLEFRRAL
jgi:pimeloyl-ACP methyl ester carboxylesterase